MHASRLAFFFFFLVFLSLLSGRSFRSPVRRFLVLGLWLLRFGIILFFSFGWVASLGGHSTCNNGVCAVLALFGVSFMHYLFLVLVLSVFYLCFESRSVSFFAHYAAGL